MNILIVGCSRLGSALACALSNRGHDVAVMDKRSDSFERLDESFTGLTSKGVPVDNDDLEAAGIESCDVVCAVTENDNENIMVAQIAGEVYKIPKVLAGIKDPDKEWVFQQCGLKTICSTLLTMDAALSVIEEYQEEHSIQFVNHKVKFYTMHIPKEYIGLKAVEIEFEENEVLYAIINEDGKFTLVNNYNILLREGDTLIFSKVVD